MKALSFTLLFFVSIFGFSQPPTSNPQTPPARNTVDVISIFSGAYNNISGANYNPNWQQTGFGTANSTYRPTGSGNIVLAYPDFNYQGIEFNSVVDITAMDSLHLDVWIDGNFSPSVTVISSGTEIPKAIPNAAGSWQSINIPVSGITEDLTRAIQLKFTGGNGTTHGIYLDNIYFFKTAVAPEKDATISALEVSDAPVPGFTPNSLAYDLALPGGTTVVPQITLATTANPAATAVITQATSIPGDATVMVTSQDGTATQTYTISFFIGAPHIDAPTPPVRNGIDVISIFSSAYNNISGANYNPDWQQSGFGTANPSFTPSGSTNAVLAYPNFSYQGIEFNSVLDISGMDFLHLDIWTVDGVAPSISVISSGAEIAHPIANGDGMWQSIDIPVSGITGDPTRIVQFKFIGGNGSSTRIYVDNLYFWKTAPTSGKETRLSNMAIDGTPIADFTPNSSTYNVPLAGGTTTPPEITLARTVDNNATTVITQANTIPASATVLVTSQDGTTTQTYTVRYFIGFPHINAPTPPARDPADVISIFSNTYNNISGANYNPNWQQSGFSTANSSFAPVNASNTVLAYPNFSYQGIEFNSVLNITDMDFLHLDIWTVDGVVPNLSVISSGTEISHPLTNGDGMWQSIDIPVAGITGDLSNANQLKLAGGNGYSTRIYVDNLYFWKGEPVGLEELDANQFSIYPNPATDYWILDGNTMIKILEVVDLKGTIIQSIDVNAKTVTINASKLENGIYFVKVTSSRGVKTFKIIKN